MDLSFIKTTTATTLVPGTVYFETSTNLIKVATSSNSYVVYGGVRSADYNQSTKILTVVNEGGYEYELDLSKPSVNNGTLTFTKNGVNIGTFSANQSADTSINLTVNELPTVTSTDNGKVLQVINGVWTLVTPVSIYSGSGSPNNAQGINGDLYMQI